MDENRNPSSGLQISDATMDEYQDALPILQAIEPALEPIEMVTAVILLIGAIIGIFSASLTVVTALVGAKTKPAKPSLDVGPPWTMWMSTGHNGARNPDDVPLIGAAGPLPEVQIFDMTGGFIGSSWDETAYAEHGAWNGLPVWPQSKEHKQTPEFVLLSFTRPGDPLCVVELGISKDADRAPSAHSGFNALTAKSCGYEWYHSGTRRTQETGEEMHMPCFWLGEADTKSAQFHLPSFSLVNDENTLKKINKSVETRHNYFCNSPAKMKFWNDAPERTSMQDRLNTEIDMHGFTTLNDTWEKTLGKKYAGRPDPGSTARRAAHEDTLSIGLKNRPGLLADELCSMGNSWGPDWVNEEEGKFCRMSDKTLWPLCSPEDLDNCFDMVLKNLVIGGKASRAMPYNREVLYGED